MTMIDDETLLETGLAPEGRGPVLLIGCGALAREILDLKSANGWDHLDLHCLPAILHNHPERIPEAVEAAVNARGADYAQVFVLYADCGTGGLLQATCERLGIGMLEGPHCYSFFEGNAVFADYLQIHFVPGTGELAVVLGAVIGAGLGFWK